MSQKKSNIQPKKVPIIANCFSEESVLVSYETNLHQKS